MKNDDFWESYRKKCKSKGIDPGSKEGFLARQQPITYSADLLLPSEKKEKNMQSKNAVEWKKCKECQEYKEEFDFGKCNNGERKDICKKCVGAKISKSRKKQSQEITADQLESLKAIVAPEEKKLPLHVNQEHEQNTDVVEELKKDIKEDDQIYIMDQDVFREAIMLAYKKGIEKGKTFSQTIKHESVNKTVSSILEACNI